ncbi:MarR family transcriptional regulator [Streptomyces armeniacus]|uniref:MarR family transcriptional regulator n=1 Tax=Streptomyces armeniacus TaxID=83291 RepID=A0A345XQQ6_9ACTN|nr:MarR family transcriptional regulator [Streptomyces armeniacus]AXK33972.1 MarR family transcriptional regulator [Streptomyces armeniacus]
MMDHTDAELAQHPVGYWTGAAHEAVIRYINAEHAKAGVTQRHWMTLNALLRNEGGLTREEVTDQLSRYMTPQIGDVSTYPAVLDDLLGRGWVAAGPDGRLTLTGEGHAGRARVAGRTEGIRAVLHEGVTDEEYAAAVRVLRRITANAGGPETL